MAFHWNFQGGVLIDREGLQLKLQQVFAAFWYHFRHEQFYRGRGILKVIGVCPGEVSAHCPPPP